MYESTNFSTSCQHLLFYTLKKKKTVAFLVGVKWYLIVGLIFISLVTNDLCF